MPHMQTPHFRKIISSFARSYENEKIEMISKFKIYDVALLFSKCVLRIIEVGFYKCVLPIIEVGFDVHMFR